MNELRYIRIQLDNILMDIEKIQMDLDNLYGSANTLYSILSDDFIKKCIKTVPKGTTNYQAKGKE